MLKKLVLAAMALVMFGGVYAVDPGGHMSTMAGYVKQWFKPGLDYQIRRADSLIGKLDDAIKDKQEFLAQEKVLLAKFEDGVSRDQVAVKAKREHVVKLRNKFSQGEQPVSIDPSRRNELARELSQLKIMDQKLETSQKILGTRKERYESLKDKVGEMLSSKETMKLRLEEMKAQLEAVRLNEAHSGKYDVDESEFKAVTDLLEEIDTAVKTRDELAKMRSTQTSEAVAVTDAVNDTVLEDVDAYLNK